MLEWKKQQLKRQLQESRYRLNCMYENLARDLYDMTFVATITSIEAIRYIPFDPSVMEPAKRRQFMIDSQQWWDRKDDRGEAGEIVLSPLDKDPEDLQYILSFQ